MSGIFGIFNRDGEAVTSDAMQEMHAAMAYWHPDTSGCWHEGPIGLGHEMLWNTPESKLEKLPNQNGQFIITMDARLDNRTQLAEQLNIPKSELGQTTDSALILGAYRKWKQECPKHLIGDFAFAIWDKTEQQLFCVRDHIGIRQFYYFSIENRFIFGNHILGVLAHPDVSNTLDEKSIGYYLRGEENNYSHTFFKSIFKLPPATSLLVGRSILRKETYWKPEESGRINFKSREQYATRLRELLEDSVNARLRSDFPITAHLSGGLDSSSIAAIAGRYLKAMDRELHAYNWIPEPTADNVDPDYYEWRYSKSLAEKEGILHHSIDLDEYILGRIFKNHDIKSNDTVDLWYEFPLRERVKREGGRTILSGWGGDELISYGGKGHVSDLFFRGQIAKSFSEFKRQANIKPSNASISLLLKAFAKRIITDSLPESLLCKLRDRYCTPSLPVPYSPATFRTFVENLRPLTKQYNAFSTRNRQLNVFRNGHLQQRIESWATSGMSERLEYAYPLLDKRLVEFALSIPAEFYVERRIFRDAMKGVLPENIRLHTEKDEPHRISVFHNLVAKALTTKIKELAEINAHLYVNYRSLEDAVNTLDLDTLPSRDEKIEKLECILRALFVYNSFGIKG